MEEFVCPLCQRLLPMAGRDGVITHVLRDHWEEPLAKAIAYSYFVGPSEENMAQQKPPGERDRESIVLVWVLVNSGTSTIYQSEPVPLNRERVDLLGRLVGHDQWRRQTTPEQATWQQIEAVLGRLED